MDGKRAVPGDLILVRSCKIRHLSQPLLRYRKNCNDFVLGSHWLHVWAEPWCADVAIVIASLRHGRGRELLDHLVVLINNGLGCCFDDFGITWVWPGMKFDRLDATRNGYVRQAEAVPEWMR
jgi:hypothetical protein